MALTPIQEIQRQTEIEVLRTRVRFLNRELRANRIPKDEHKRRAKRAQKILDRVVK